MGPVRSHFAKSYCNVQIHLLYWLHQTYIYEGGIQMKTIGKGNVKGNPRIKHWANDYPGFDQSKDADSQNKTMWPKRTGHSNAIRLTIPGMDQVRYTADETWSAANKNRRQTELRQIAGWSDCQLTADALRLQMNHVCTKKEFWYRKRVPQSADGEFSWRKCVCRRRQGYLPKIVTKIYEMPTTFESSVVK